MRDLDHLMLYREGLRAGAKHDYGRMTVAPALLKQLATYVRSASTSQPALDDASRKHR
jgi:hypothetical protein